MKRATILLFATLAGTGVTGCDPKLQNLDTGGNAPLVVDLDVESPIEVCETGPGIVCTDESGTTVRGPDKGKGERGGFTGSFIGNGGPMCAIIDPEGSFSGANHLDDGDSDLFVGRAADYTGTPGVTIGEFSGEYVDALGVSHVLNQNICVQYGHFGAGAHAGSATVEACEVPTDPGVPYILLGETFSVPPDDGLLIVAVQVRAGPCEQVTESTLDGDGPP